MTRSIAILDEDHVVGLVDQLLKADHAATDPLIRGFFAPEVCNLEDLRKAASGLTEADGVRVVRCAKPEDAIGSQVWLFRRGQVTKAMMEANPALVLVQRWGERAEVIDCDAARARGVWVSCLPRPMLHFVAEHVILLALALLKKLFSSDKAVRSPAASDGVAPVGQNRYNWPGIPGVYGLYGKTLGIVGMGEIGYLVAQKAKALGVKVLYTNRNRLSGALEQAVGAHFTPLDELLQASDLVSLHATFRPGSEVLMTRERLQRMKPGALLINTGRGQLVDEDALHDALVSGRLGGAGLDVHLREPRPAGDRFLALENVVLTPHFAGGSRLATEGELEGVLANIRHAFDGKPPEVGRVA